MRFSLATIAFDRESAQMSQILSSQGENAPSNPYPHYLVRLSTSRNSRDRHLRKIVGRGEEAPTPTLSILLRKPPVLLRADFVLTKDPGRSTTRPLPVYLPENCLHKAILGPSQGSEKTFGRPGLPGTTAWCAGKSALFCQLSNKQQLGHRQVDPCFSCRVSQGHPAGVPIFLKFMCPFLS